MRFATFNQQVRAAVKALKAKFAEAGNPKVEVLVTLGGHPPKSPQRHLPARTAPSPPPK